MNIRAEILCGPEERKARLFVRKKPKQVDLCALTDISISREEHRRTDMRQEERPAPEGGCFQLEFRDRRHEVKVVNLSGGGAMIAGNLAPNIGERVDLHMSEGETIDCVVRWVKDGRLGVEFAHETKLECPQEKRDAVLREAVSKLPHEVEMLPLAPDLADNRVADRHPLIWSGELRHGSHRCPVRLRNISATGALVQCSRPLRIDAEVVLDLGDECALDSWISWVVGDHAGLRFAEPFDLEQLSACKPQVTPHTWLRPAYLDSNASAESAWDGPWNRMSLNELRSQLDGFLKR